MSSSTSGNLHASFFKMLWQIFTVTAVFLSVVFSWSVQAQQSATAVLTGTIKDQNNAVVVGASVTVKQLSTGAERETTSNDRGSFVVTNLAGDVYQVRVQARGFAENVVPAVSLQVGQTADIEIVVAVAAPQSETVVLDHRFNYELVNTSTAVVDGVIRELEIQSLPLNGRN